MKPTKPVEFFIDDILHRISYHEKENDLSYAELIGALEIIKQKIMIEMFELISEEDLEEPDEKPFS